MDQATRNIGDGRRHGKAWRAQKERRVAEETRRRDARIAGFEERRRRQESEHYEHGGGAEEEAGDSVRAEMREEEQGGSEERKRKREDEKEEEWMERLVEKNARRRRSQRRWEASWEVALTRGTVRTEVVDVDRRERGAGREGKGTGRLRRRGELGMRPIYTSTAVSRRCLWMACELTCREWLGVTA